MPHSLSDEIADACRNILPPKDCAKIRTLDSHAAFNYACVALISTGMEDPADFFRKNGILA